MTDGAKYRGWVPRCRGWAHAGSNLGLQSQQTPAAAACSAAAARRPTMRSPDPDKKSTYLNKAEGGPWPGVSECRSDLRPSVRWRLNTLLALSNLDLVHLCLVVTQASLCTICPSVISVPAWCAGLCKSSYLHSLAGWVLTSVTCHVADATVMISTHLSRADTGLISIPSILTFTSLVQLVGCPVELSNK